MTVTFSDLPQVVSLLFTSRHRSPEPRRTQPQLALHGGILFRNWESASHRLASGSCVSQRSPGHDSPPACNTFFRYLGSGKIFLHDAEGVGRRSRTNPAHRRIEYFWLCGKCCSAMHLMRGTDGEVRIVSLPGLPILMSL
jgi:hypothetical protein